MYSCHVADPNRTRKSHRDGGIISPLRDGEAPLLVRSALPVDAEVVDLPRGPSARCALVDALSVKESPYKNGGVYVVLGDTDGIAQVFSRVAIEHYQAQIVWLGRRPKSRPKPAAPFRNTQGRSNPSRVRPSRGLFERSPGAIPVDQPAV